MVNSEKVENVKVTTEAVAAPGAVAVTKAAQFLLARLEEFIRDADDMPSITRGWFGHVEPAIKRLEAALRPEEAAGQGEARRCEGQTCYYLGCQYLPGCVHGAERATPRPAPVAPETVEPRHFYKQAQEALDAAHKACFNHPDRGVIGMSHGPFSGVNEALGIIATLEETITALSSELAEAKRESARRLELLRKDPKVVLIAHEDGDHQRLSRGLAKQIDLREAAEAEVARLKARVNDLLTDYAETTISDNQLGRTFARALQPAEKDKQP